MFPKVIDSSILNDVKDCETKFQLAHVEDWKLRGQSVHLHAGGAFAKGCEVTRSAFYLGEHDHFDAASADWTRISCTAGDREYAIEAGTEALLAAYGDFDCPTDSAKSAVRMADAFVFYWDHYPLNYDAAFPVLLPGNKRGIEFNFAHPLPIDNPDTGEPLIYTGRLDAILNYAGAAWGFDEKTTTSLGSTWGNKWSLRGQFLGYTWGCRQAGIDIKGIVVRGVSILKTKCDTQESINEYPEWMIDRWYMEMLTWVQRAVDAYKRKSFLHNFGEACTQYGGCQFTRMCGSSDPQSYLETYCERRHWDPVTRKETKL